MQRIAIDSGASLSPNFIGSWIIQPPSLCDELITFFDSHPEHQAQGKTAGGLNLNSKKSTDLTIRPHELSQPGHEPVQEYLRQLFACHQDYAEQWPFLREVVPKVEVGSFNIQRYEPGGHFLKVHSERTTLATSHRILAWMTYLNDVEDGGLPTSCIRASISSLRKAKHLSGPWSGPTPIKRMC